MSIVNDSKLITMYALQTHSPIKSYVSKERWAWIGKRASKGEWKGEEEGQADTPAMLWTGWGNSEKQRLSVQVSSFLLHSANSQRDFVDVHGS